MLQHRVGSFHFQLCAHTQTPTHTQTHNEVMIWRIGLLFSAEALLTWEIVARDLQRGSRKERLQLKRYRYLNQHVHNHPLPRGCGGATRSGNSTFGLLWQSKSICCVCLIERLLHSCYHNQCWISAEWVYLFSKRYRGLDIFCAWHESRLKMLVNNEQYLKRTKKTKKTKPSSTFFDKLETVCQGGKNVWRLSQASSHAFTWTRSMKSYWDLNESSRLKRKEKQSAHWGRSSPGNLRDFLI